MIYEIVDYKTKEILHDRYEPELPIKYNSGDRFFYYIHHPLKVQDGRKITPQPLTTIITYEINNVKDNKLEVNNINSYTTTTFDFF